MSRASDWAKRKPKDLHLRSQDGPYTTLVFLVADNGLAPGMRIDNAGPFNRQQSLRLARWILNAFGP